MTAALESPVDDDELFDLDEDALRLKPVMTGDVFMQVLARGEDAPVDVVVAGHPCTIRRGAVLADRVPCVRIVDHQWLKYSAWPRHDQGHFPLSPGLALGGERCAHLGDWISVDSTELTRERRRATMQDRGIHVFQQRLIHSLSRFVVPIDALAEASAHVLAEAELEMSWLFELAASDVDNEGLAALVLEFDAWMGNGNRKLLRSDERRVRKALAQELRERQSV